MWMGVSAWTAITQPPQWAAHRLGGAFAGTRRGMGVPQTTAQWRYLRVRVMQCWAPLTHAGFMQRQDGARQAGENE